MGHSGVHRVPPLRPPGGALRVGLPAAPSALAARARSGSAPHRRVLGPGLGGAVPGVLHGPLPPRRPLLLPVLSHWHRGLPGLVHRPVEQLHYPLPAGRGQGRGQGEPWPPTPLGHRGPAAPPQSWGARTPCETRGPRGWQPPLPVQRGCCCPGHSGLSRWGGSEELRPGDS